MTGNLLWFLAILSAGTGSGIPPTPPIPVPTSGGGGTSITAPARDHRAWLTRDYREREHPQRITRVHGIARPLGVLAVARVGVARARGAVGYQPAVARPQGVAAIARVGQAIGHGSARVTVKARRPMSADEWFLLGFTAGQDDE